MNKIINIAIYITPNTITDINIPKLVLLLALPALSKLSKKSSMNVAIESLMSLTEFFA